MPHAGSDCDSVPRACEDHPLRRDHQGAGAQFLFENTGIPVRYYDPNERAEGTQLAATIKRLRFAGKVLPKFRSPEAISIFVAGERQGNSQR